MRALVNKKLVFFTGSITAQLKAGAVRLSLSLNKSRHQSLSLNGSVTDALTGPWIENVVANRRMPCVGRIRRVRHVAGVGVKRGGQWRCR